MVAAWMAWRGVMEPEDAKSEPWEENPGRVRGPDDHKIMFLRCGTEIAREQTLSWRHYELWTRPVGMLGPREQTSGVPASSGRVTEDGGADTTRFSPLQNRL